MLLQTREIASHLSGGNVEQNALAKPEMRRAGVGVIVIGDVAHVVVHLPSALPQNGVGHGREKVVQGRLNLGWRRGVVNPPHDHGH